ncbi:hypothetical protein PWT90_08059 [Aphanocladium album]|nr:hypothetical protein PWT90_08059 [Aphanocladium album]
MAAMVTAPLTQSLQNVSGAMAQHSDQLNGAGLSKSTAAAQPLTLLKLQTTTSEVSTSLRTDLPPSWGSRFEFRLGGIEENWEWVESQMKDSDIILPLAAIATPASYVEQPLRVFELDFEVNLRVIRLVVKHNKPLVFPSTSEVYGMYRDEQFNPELSELQEGLKFTTFRPFNWFGPGLDDVNSAKAGLSRVRTQFLGDIARGEDISLVDGGSQRRTFTYIEDDLDALWR